MVELLDLEICGFSSKGDSMIRTHTLNCGIRRTVRDFRGAIQTSVKSFCGRISCNCVRGTRYTNRTTDSELSPIGLWDLKAIKKFWHVWTLPHRNTLTILNRMKFKSVWQSLIRSSFFVQVCINIKVVSCISTSRFSKLGNFWGSSFTARERRIQRIILTKYDVNFN